MNKFLSLLRAKGWYRLAAYVLCLVGLVADIVFVAVDGSDQTFTWGCFICIMAGSIVGLLDLLIDARGICLWLSSLLYILGCGFHLVAALPSISDLWNNVNFIGGNQEAAILFGSVFLVLMFCLIVLNFFQSEKKE